MGVAEQLLAPQHADVAVHDVLAGGQVVQLDEALLEPLPVRVLGGQRRLDLLVVDDAPLGGVDEEHPSRLQPALGDDLGGVDVDDADLGRHHDEVVVGDPVAARPQAVAVEHGADHRAVGEGDAGRAVPRLHHAGVEAVEVPLGRVEVGVVLPRFGDHHQHGVVDGAAAEVEQLEHLVEAGGVGGARRADREGPVDALEDRAVEHRLAGPHPVLVALDGVDLAVVGDVAVRVGQRPGRERVRREAAVDQQQRALDPLVQQVGEELGQLGGGQHPLVDEGAGRQRREVGRDLRLELVLDALAGEVHLAVESQPGGPGGVGHEELGEGRHHRASGGPEAARIDRDLAPGDDLQALVGDDGLDGRLGLLGRQRVGREEAHPDGVGTGRRELDPLLVGQDLDAGSGRGPGSGCRRRHRCRARHRSPRGGRGWSGPRGPVCTSSWLATPLMWATNETPHESCSNRGS